MANLRKYILINGRVQGVGFRPFIYNLAVSFNLMGWVNNTSSGIVIDIEGMEENIDSFIENINNNPPPLARISNIIINSKELVGYRNFEIKISKEMDNVKALISPDIAICHKCKEEILDRNSRRDRYAFTNCTNCGPRFSIIKKLPYDRAVTTMKTFKMCPSCEEEYNNPLNRRFHAETNACPKCGPRTWLINDKQEIIEEDNALEKTVELLKVGKIIAVKGIGGFQLVCDATNYDSICRLRYKKNRQYKPMAVMARDIEVVKKYCYLSEYEEKVILSNKAPIIILKRRMDMKLPGNLVFENNTLGIMLPYSPLHYLLFDDEIELLVVTSANISGESIIYKNKEALENLKNIVDYFLMHNREIHLPVDDSVTKVVCNEERIIRLARGYAPCYINKEKSPNILAYGSHLKNTYAMSKDDSIYISEFIGDMENVETIKRFERSLNHFKSLYKIEPDIIAYDMHPNYWCMDIVNDFRGKKFAIQHHHAHIASCMAENDINEKVIGVVFDGTGYGADKNIWGGEIFICDLKEYTRGAHIDYFSLPGGESAIKEPWKIALALLYKAYKDDIDNYLPEDLRKKEKDIILRIIKKNFNTPLTSSMGRLFDGVAALIGFNREVTFEGEAAIFLENMSNEATSSYYTYDIKEMNNIYIIETNKVIEAIINDLQADIKKEIIARKFHNTVIQLTVDSCKRLRKKFNINKVALSGGVFQNNILFEGIYEKLEEVGFQVITHKKLPCNDSGISFGQLIIAREIYKGER